MDDGLTKARRNLIIVSVVLVLFDIAAVSISKVSVLGTELLIGTPAVLRTFLWVLWGYLLLRYAQFLGAEDDLGIRKEFIRKMNRLLLHKIAEFSKKQEPQWGGNLGEVSVEWLRRKGLNWYHPLYRYDPGKGERVELNSSRIPGYVVIYALIRASAYVVVMTPKATEHIFPLALALSAPLVTVVK